MDPGTAFSGIPDGLREPLLDAFGAIMRNFRERRWEPSELNGGKLCEVVYSILRGHVDGRMPSKPSKPKNMLDACQAFEKADLKVFPRAVRIQIPRMLIALYEIRNNRGVGHVGGDVDPNHMDSKVVVEMAKWVMADLVRVFHKLDTAAATQVVEGLIERTVPVVWEVEGRRRVLRPELAKKDQTLLVLYSVSRAVKDSELVTWVEYSNLTGYRRDVLRPAHDDRLIEYDEGSKEVRISPLGIAWVEDRLPLDI
jgi:hypothetical protein